MSEISQSAATTSTSTAPTPALPKVVADNLHTTYANVCRISQTPNEVLVDFGLNPNFFGQILDEPLRLNQRVILSHDSAKRLLLHLAQTIQAYEAKYGTIELDVAKRMVAPQQPK